MADISITAANVVSGTGSNVDHSKAGATITAGQVVYEDANGKEQLADNNSATALARLPKGFALNGAALNQPLAVHTKGPLTVGAVLTAGVTYYLSDTPGGMCPVADVGSGEYSVILGIALSTSILDVDIHASGVAL